ncbi:MAG: hypothetical protein ACJ71E_07160 [Nitrososphaeraceae archaeon]
MMDIISMFSIQKAKEKLADCNVLLKYMAFLQNNGFSDYGKGQIMGQVALLKEYLEDGVEQKERDKEESKDSILTDNNKMYKDKKVVEQQIVITKDNTLYEQAGEKIAETIFRKGISNPQNNNNNNNNNKSGLLKGVENIIDKARDIRILE